MCSGPICRVFYSVWQNNEKINSWRPPHSSYILLVTLSVLDWTLQRLLSCYSQAAASGGRKCTGSRCCLTRYSERERRKQQQRLMKCFVCRAYKTTTAQASRRQSKHTVCVCRAAKVVSRCHASLRGLILKIDGLIHNINHIFELCTAFWMLKKRNEKVVYKSQTNCDVGKHFFVFVDGAETVRERNPVSASLHFLSKYWKLNLDQHKNLKLKQTWQLSGVEKKSIFI